MKKLLLNIALFVGATTMGFAQHVQTLTGFTNNGDLIGTLATDGFGFTIWPTDGGFDETTVDELKLGYYVPAAGTMYVVMTLNVAVDMSGTGNNKMQFDFRATGSGGTDTTLNTTIKLENASTSVSEEVAIVGTQVESILTPTFTAASGQDLTAVKKITITLVNAGPTSRVGAIYLSNIQAGSSVVVASTSSSSSSLVASTKLFPNPVSDQANLELNLQATSSVKVTLSDLMGKEVMTIAEGTMTSLTKEFSVANLNKGLYTVNYFVNGAAAKSELLMVK